MLINFKSYHCGKFISSANKLIVTNKFTNKAYAETYLCNREQVLQSIDFAHQLKSICKELSKLERKNALVFIAANLSKQKKHIAELISIESAKPIQLAQLEVERSITCFKIAASEVNLIPSEILDFKNLPNGTGKLGKVNYFPIGVIAGISPFNFPLNLAVHKIAPAIATGCPIVLKPASTTPLASLALAKIIHQSNLPKGMIQVIPMDRHVGNLLVENEKVNLLSFTGSPEVGWEMKNKSGKKKVVLELGGNAATIISEHCNLETIIDKCVYGAFAYSGQICIHAQRFYVHAKHYKIFINQMKVAATQLIKGDPLNPSTQLSVMIDEANAIRAEKWTLEALEQGAKLICGGKRQGSYFEPTILTNTNTKMLVNKEEVFAPIICIEQYSGSIDKAIKLANDTKFGLQCGVFTNNKVELNKCFEQLDVGGVIHNHVPTLRFDSMPYGGIKESGLGREGIKYAMMDMLEPKVLVY
jgi:acyl-CoA reductase-like NAD-dependent aldehyde dehydrogenase